MYKTTDLELPPGGNKIVVGDLGFWKLVPLGSAVVYNLAKGTQAEVLGTPQEFCYIPPVAPNK